MSSVRLHQLFARHPDNPILTPEDWPYTVNTVFNPGATIGPDGETVLLVRVEDRTGLSHFTSLAATMDSPNGGSMPGQPSNGDHPAMRSASESKTLGSPRSERSI